jgi:hypothetical protein
MPLLLTARKRCPVSYERGATGVHSDRAARQLHLVDGQRTLGMVAV